MKIVTPPLIEPVSLAEVKEQIGIQATDTVSDALITRRIVEARKYAEDYTGRALITQTREKRWDDALKLQDRLYPLHAALFTDASPAPTKYALTRIKNDFPADLRLPLVEASDASKRAVDAALEHAGLI